MVRHIFLLNLLLIGYSHASSTDSLLIKLEVSQDTARVTLWNQLGINYRYQDLGKADAYLDSALQLAQQLDYQNGTGQAYLHLGGNAIIRGETEIAISHTQKALATFKKINNQAGMADATKNLGLLAYHQGNYEVAKARYSKALATFYQIRDTVGRAKCYANLGLVHVELGEFDQALTYFMNGLRCNELLDNQEGIASGYSYVALVYRLNQNLAQALEYQKKALAIFRITNNQIRQSLLLSEMGNTYHQLQDWEEALVNYQKALTLQKELGNEREMGTTLGNIGTVYEKLHQLDQAQAYYLQSLAIARKVGNQGNIPKLLMNLAELALEKRDFDTAIEYLSQTIELAQTLGHKKDLHSAHNLLHQVYEVQGNYLQALEHYQTARAYQDSLFNEEKARQIAELQTKYEVEKKEQQIEAQAQEIALLARAKQAEKRVRWTLMAALGLLLILILFVYNRYRLKQQSARLLSEKNQEIESKNHQISLMNQELEKRMLRAQMDPHFIFNSLNSIQHLITINDKTSSLKYLSKFSKLVRRVLENSVNTQVPLADEITLLKHYIELEQLRYNHSFEYSINVDASVDVHDTEIPFLLIQPYVENALVHGLRHKPEEGWLKIELKQRESDLWCIVEDNGVGRKEAKRRKQQSTLPSRGMSVTQQRLETLNQGKSRKTSVHILDLTDKQNHPLGTRVEIIVPLNEELCSAPLL
jgi:tetratricopeptide (TPR) repeat protein